MPIYYKAGYKYQLAKPYSLKLPHSPDAPVCTSYVALGEVLAIREGYAWDGASGPTIDTKDSMRGSLVHDALYQLIRLGHLPEDPWRLWADELLRDLCLEDGMNPPRANLWFNMVRAFAGAAAHPSAERPTLEAP
jgi:hypothetical protein